MLCGKCGAQVGDDFKFCPECGTPMPVVRKAAEKALNQGEEPLEKVKAEAAEAIGEVKEAVEEAKDDLREIGAEVKEELSDVAEKAEEVKEKNADKISDAKDSVEDKVKKVKKDVAEIEENAKQAVKEETEKEKSNKMENPVKQKNEAPVDAKKAQDKKRITNFIWCMAVLAIAVLIACMARANQKVPVELDNFITITYDGYDTEGTAKAHFDKKAFVADYGEQVEDINGLIADCIDGNLSEDEGLSNGDKVVYQWDVDAETAESNYKVLLSYNDIEDTVSGLEDLPDTTGMVFPDSADIRLNNSDIDGMDMDELRSALNEIYARHGYIFHNEKYQKEFESYSWYEPTVDADDWDGDTELNRVEKYNVEFLKNAIKELKEKAA
jgi:hypothetical protein